MYFLHNLGLVDFFPSLCEVWRPIGKLRVGGVGVTASHFGVDDLVYVSRKWP